MFESPGPDYNLWLNQFNTSLRTCDNISENLRGKLEYDLTLKKNNSELAKTWELWKHLVINESCNCTWGYVTSYFDYPFIMQRTLHSQKDYYTTWIIAIRQTHVQCLLICYFFKKSGKNFGKVIRVMDDARKDKWCVILHPHLPLRVLFICPRATGNDTSHILKPPYVKTTFLPTIITFWK